MSRLVFHIDVNSAYLSWEAARRVAAGEADLRLIPSAIGGDREKRTGVILAKSIPAKKFGVRTGEPVAMALRKCPDLVLARPDFRLYEQSSKAFMDICRDIEHEARRLRKYLAQANRVIGRIVDVREREVLELRYLSGYDFEDIARKMFLSERTVRRIHVKALEHVQREMDVIEYAEHRPGWNPKQAQAAYVQ
jgi:DNA polymerase-4